MIEPHTQDLDYNIRSIKGSLFFQKRQISSLVKTGTHLQSLGPYCIDVAPQS